MDYISKENLIHNYISVYKYKNLKKRYDARVKLVEQMRDFLADRNLLSDFLDSIDGGEND